MANKDKKAVKSNLTVLLSHLLKYKYQPYKRTNSWRYTIDEHRDRLIEDFVNSPSLTIFFREIFDESSNKARQQAAKETKLPLETFPIESPFTPEEVLDIEHLPD